MKRVTLVRTSAQYQPVLAQLAATVLLAATALLAATVLLAAFVLAGSLVAEAGTLKKFDVPLGDSPYIGPETAPITIIEFIDYQ